MPSVQLQHVQVRYGAQVAVHDVSLDIAAREVHVLLGPSGSGKTTLLRAIAGFQPIGAGRLLLQDEVVDDGRHALPPEQRGVGVVFQDYALFPHLSVAGNVAFGMQKTDRAAVDALLEEVGLTGYGPRPVSALSGGEQQRVALARTLAQRPRVILLDEPFSNLNPVLRHQLRDRTVELIRQHGITAALVTHDRGEAFAVADRISVLRDGLLLQTGTPRELYEAPASLDVATSVGEAFAVPATPVDGAMDTPLGRIGVRGAAEGDRVILRPEQLRLVAQGAARGEVTRVTYQGATDRVEVRVGELRLHTDTSPALHQVGQPVGIEVTGPGVAIRG